MCSKKRLPAAALSKTKVEVRKIGGFSAPSESAGSNPWPIINVAGFSLRPPSSRTSAFGRRRAVGIVAGPLGSCERVITRRLLSKRRAEAIVYHRTEERRGGKERGRTSRSRGQP